MLPSCCCSVTKLCPTLCDFMDCSMPGFPVLHSLLEFAQSHVPWVSDAINSLILCCPLLLPSVFPSLRVFSKIYTDCAVWGTPLSLHKTWSCKFQSHNMAASFSAKWLALHTGLYLITVWVRKQTWVASESRYLIKLSSIWLHNKVTLDSRWIKQKWYWSFILRNSTSYWCRMGLGISVYQKHLDDSDGFMALVQCDILPLPPRILFSKSRFVISAWSQASPIVSVAVYTRPFTPKPAPDKEQKMDETWTQHAWFSSVPPCLLHKWMAVFTQWTHSPFFPP